MNAFFLLAASYAIHSAKKFAAQAHTGKAMLLFLPAISEFSQQLLF